MNPAADQARAMGDYIREHGFSPLYSESLFGRADCGCFAHAYDVLYDDAIFPDPFEVIRPALLGVLGAKSIEAHDLVVAGYASDADRDKAVDACYAAARLLEGKS